MPTITLTPKNFGKKIGSLYDQVLQSDGVVITIRERRLSTKKDIEDMTLLEYIHSNEYKKDPGESFDSVEDFLADLKQHKN